MYENVVHVIPRLCPFTTQTPAKTGHMMLRLRTPCNSLIVLHVDGAAAAAAVRRCAGSRAACAAVGRLLLLLYDASLRDLCARDAVLLALLHASIHQPAGFGEHCA